MLSQRVEQTLDMLLGEHDFALRLSRSRSHLEISETFIIAFLHPHNRLVRPLVKPAWSL